MTTVNILGTEYKVIREPFKDKGVDGYCDYTSREIRIRDDNVNEDVGLCYEAKFNYKTLENIYWGEPFYSFARNEIKRGLLDHRYEILIAATFPKDMPQEKARKIMKDRVVKWKAEREGL